MKNQTIELTEMLSEDIEDAVDLIKFAMDEDEARWAKQTMNFHFGCKKNKLDDGRNYYLWKVKGKIKGIVGLHRYIWGPVENVWLAWFAVSPEYQGHGYGRKLLLSIEKKAINLGFRKFFVETYNNPVFEKAIRFYKKAGFVIHGKIDNYLPDGSEMIVLYKKI